MLSFCKDTFSWGDYIDRVWDRWLADTKGRLLVGESAGKKMALARVSMCPGNIAWLEGVRVHPDFRRAKVATALLERMAGWAARHGAKEASAIVSQENVPSQRMLEKNGFSMVSAWIYYGTEKKMNKRATSARLATKQDIEKAWQFLQGSHIYQRSAGRYVSSWKWYPLDRKALRQLVLAKRVVVTGRPVSGLAVLNKTGYWDRPDILQVSYLDASGAKPLQDIIAFASNLHSQGYSTLHVLCHNSPEMTPMVEKSGMDESEVFLLYSKKVFTPRKALRPVGQIRQDRQDPRPLRGSRQGQKDDTFDTRAWRLD
ncbi:MAG: GNAT family N-acetyltransferase [Nitrososphaera sp.]|uniref:GNAT family N-acetyltransferase n=1 Tax=Nitrososphaera sp. TaxID=1971748 RepID=UPI0025FB3FB3|nr:GNAT family N-acetyltransferase [Nitrososphaera sp.]